MTRSPAAIALGVAAALCVAACSRNGNGDQRPAPPTIASQPVRQLVGVGRTATFGVVAVGTGTLRFEWRKNGVPEPVAPEYVTERPLVPSAYTTFPLSAEDDGARYSVLVSDAFGGAVLSDEAVAAVGGFYRTGSLTTARRRHASLLLSSGEVLVSGGVSSSYITGPGHAPPADPPLATAETYDPGTGAWTATGPQTEGRAEHTVTLLPSGEVLATGGSPALATAELYDPTTRTWSATGSLATGRCLHEAVLLPSGKVLVYGGGVWDDAGSTLVKVGTAELYDPATRTWSPVAAPPEAGATMPWERQSGAAVLLPSGKVLSVGSTSTALYDPEADAWTAASAPPTGGASVTALLLPSGNVLAIAPWNGSTAIYDPVRDSWSPPQARATNLYGATLCLLPTGEVLASGGSYYDSIATASLYDPATGTWSALPAATASRTGHRCTTLASGQPLLTGGARIESSIHTVVTVSPVAELFRRSAY